MTGAPIPPAASHQAAVDAVLLILERMGLCPDDLTAAAGKRPSVPTFADYVPVVSAAVTAGTLKAYGSYWNRVTEQWGARRLDEPTPSEIRQLVSHVRANVVRRRNARGGRGAAENLIAALRCLYRHAEDDGPATIDDMGSLFCPRPAQGGRRTAAKNEWSDAVIRAQLALSELERADRILRIVTRRDVWFMIPDDWTSLIEHTQQALTRNTAEATGTKPRYETAAQTRG